MEETKSGISPTGLVILLVLLFLFMRQGGLFGNGFGWGGNGYGFPGFGWGNLAGDFGFQNYRATCDAEKTEMMNFSDIQHQIATTSAATQASIYADGNATRNLITQQEIQGLRDRLDDAHRENLVLSNQLFVKDQLAPITAQLNSIQNNMLVRPNVTGVGAVCPNAGIINGLGIGGCGCGSTLGGVVA
jgi:hypothetical protein